MSSFTECPPLIAIPPDYKLYKVQTDFEYHVGAEDSNEIIYVKAGTITDGASIPKFAWSIIGGPLGRYAPAAVVHDECYRRKLYPRKRCDQIFLEAMKVLRIWIIKRLMMYRAVRLFGWMAWNKKKKAR